MNQEIKIAEKMINQKNYLNSKYFPIHLFATENILGFTSKINFSNQTILTVCSSSDQLLNMLLYGAKGIDTFDINEFTKNFFYLKESAIRTLSYLEFLDFFFPTHPLKQNHVFSYTTYLRITENIKDASSKDFWDYLFFKYNGIFLYYSNLFTQEQYSKKTTCICNSYLSNKENYNHLKEKLNSYDFCFYQLNILKDKLPTSKQYDFIYLSNIFDYLNFTNELDYVQHVKEIIISLKKNLTPTGMIGIAYLYCYLDDYWYENNIGKLKSQIIRLTHFKEDCTYIDFQGINNINSKNLKDRDALMLTRKK